MTHHPLRSIWVAVLLALVAAAVLLCSETGTSPCNDSSRLATAESLVNRHTMAINDSYFAYTCDYLEIDGVKYSEKPPVLSLALAAMYGAVTGVTGWTASHDLGSLYYLLTLMTSGLALLAIALALFLIARRLGAHESTSFFVACAGSLGTLAFSYSSVICNHVVGAAFLTWAAYHVLTEDAEVAPKKAMGTGLLLGLAVTVDPLAVAFAGPLVLLSVWHCPRRAIWLILGASPPVLVHAAVCWAIVGNPIAMNLNPEHFEYAGSLHNRETLTGVGWKHDSLSSFATYAYDSLAGYRGFAVYNLPSVLGLGGLGYLAIRERSRWSLAILVGVALFFVLTLGFSNNFGGSGYAVRWHALMAPLAAVGLAATLPDKWTRIQQAAIALALVVGVPLAAIGTNSPLSVFPGEVDSFVKVTSSPKENVAFFLPQAAALYQHGRYAEASYFAELGTRHMEAVPELWFVMISAAIALDDRDKLREYRTRLDSIQMAHAEQLRRQIDDYLTDSP